MNNHSRKKGFCGRLASALLLTLVLVGLLSAAALAAEDAYMLGNQQQYTLTHEVRVTNSSSQTATNVTVEIPLPDSLSGLPYCQIAGTEYDPAPTKIITEAGHQAAVFNLASLPAGKSVVLTQRYALRCYEVAYSFNRSAVGTAYSAAERAALSAELAPTALIQSDRSAVAEFAAAHRGPSDNLYQIARQLFAAVNQYLDYDTTAADQSSLAVLNRGRASCEGYVNLYLACLRSSGVACRQVSGYLYKPAEEMAANHLRADSLRHTWVEFYLPDLGWVPADPTFTYTFEVEGVESKFVDWGYFANISAANHYIAFRAGDTDADKIRLLSATGGQVSTQFSSFLNEGFVYQPFDDINGHWAQAAILFCAENGLFQGVSLTSFAPEASMTRAMFVTVLGRLYAQDHRLPDSSAQLARFNDIKADDYYGKYLGWAVENGIISGYGDGRFGPNDPVTREQMATIISAYLKLNGHRLGDVSQLTRFTDCDLISSWARPGTAACISAGLLSGYPDGSFHPRSLANRAQVAAIMQRLSNWLAAQSRSAVTAGPVSVLTTIDAPDTEAAPEAAPTAPEAAPETAPEAGEAQLPADSSELSAGSSELSAGSKAQPEPDEAY